MSDECGCCPPTSPTTPNPVGNRPGLSEIGYRSGTWADFRGAMLSRLTASLRLSTLRTREPDDPTVALLDAWAVTCDVLTFYNERLAQESFLRTAADTVSLQELGRLIGYRLGPGVAAETHLAFTLERPPQLPALSSDPGLAPPETPAEVTLPVGLRVQSIPGPGERPVTFETVEEVIGRPEWSSMGLASTKWIKPVGGHRGVWFKGTDLNLNPGAAILLSGRTPQTTDFKRDHWDLRLVTSVAIDRDLDLTGVTFEWPLGSFRPRNRPAADPAGFVLRKRLDVFGHNAPVWRAMNEDYRRGYATALTSDEKTIEDITRASEWEDFTSLRTEAGDLVIDLDGAHPDVVVGSWVVVSQEAGTFYRELYAVTKRAELSRAEFGITGTVTRLTLWGEPRSFGTPRQVSVFAVSEPLALTERPDPDDVSGEVIVVDADATAMLPGRAIYVTGQTDAGLVAELAVVNAVAPAGKSPFGAARTQITLRSRLVNTFRRKGALVLGNVVRATHGETVHEVLGSGDARRTFQKFALAQGPLTHVQADNAAGSSSTLQVSVDGVTWTQVPSHYLAAPSDRTYTHSPGAEPNPTTGLPSDLVVIGDGTHGSRAATGSHNVRATYRKGLGSSGNLAADRLAQPLDRPLGVKAATNPIAATGGADPERAGDARLSMPVSTRTLGRAVSLGDYADFSLTFAGISRAEARVLPLRSGRTVVVSVCGPEASEAPPTTVEHLRKALRNLGDPLVRADVVPASIARFRLALRLAIDPAHDEALVIAAVSTALHLRFDPAARALGEPVNASAIIAVAANVSGVLAVDLDSLYRVGAGGPALTERLFAEPAHVDTAGQAVGTELLGLDTEQYDSLDPMT